MVLHNAILEPFCLNVPEPFCSLWWKGSSDHKKVRYGSLKTLLMNDSMAKMVLLCQPCVEPLKHFDFFESVQYTGLF